MIAYLFDIDGVLTDPVEKRVTEPELFNALHTLLQQGDFVCFNTGRSITWIIERVINPFFDHVEQKELLKDVIAIAEKGGTWLTFDGEGAGTKEKDEALMVSSALREHVKHLVEKEYSDAMFFDTTKETMISVEMDDGFDLATFHIRQQKFVKEVEKILAQTKFLKKYKIDPSTISTDIEEKHVGKALGAKRFLTFLKARYLTAQQFFCFGDSNTDFEMADYLAVKGNEVTFVYTGDKEKLGEINKAYPVIFEEGYSQGTLRYLASHVTE